MIAAVAHSTPCNTCLCACPEVHACAATATAAAPAAAAAAARSVALGQAAGDRTGNLQDVLRLLTLWFTWGSAPDVESALNEGFGLVSIDTWLGVIPQIIARIHTNNPQVGPVASDLSRVSNSDVTAVSKTLTSLVLVT